MLGRLSAAEGDAVAADKRDCDSDSITGRDSLDAGLSADSMVLPTALPSSLARRSDETSSSTGSKQTTEASTLPTRSIPSPPDGVHQTDSVRDSAGKPV